jgi:chromate reductase, NAD(P)H dehydrogenase (quinone)
MTRERHVLLVSGSLRAGSTNAALLLTAQALTPPGVTAVIYQGADRLPHFNPDHDKAPLNAEVSGLRSAIGAADAILFCTPEYAGALPGSFKNLLDWTVGDAQPRSIHGKPVAWVNASASPTGAADAHRSLRIVLGYVGAEIVDDGCVSIPVTRQLIGDDGLIHEPSVRAGILAALAALIERT